MIKAKSKNMKARIRRTLADRDRRLVQIEFPAHIADRLTQVAETLGVTKSDIVREAVTAGLDELEST